jgi:RNA polymerase sigma-70 factor (TIGR02960 family)
MRGRRANLAACVLNPMSAPDTDDFAARAERHRPALRAHLYRMTASFEEAEDLVQETLLRAWRNHGSFEGRSSLRVWLYRIATNTGLDALRRRPDKVALGKGVEVPWLQPYPDELLDQIASEEEEPGAMVTARETIELAFLVAVQHLPPRQRAVLLMRDVLGWSAAQTADALGQSVPAVNSALQRAHSTLREHLPERRSEWTAPEPSPEDRRLLERYMDAHERADAEAVAELLGDEMRFTMPPQPTLITGPEAFVRLLADEGFGPNGVGEFRLVPTRANRQLAAANYVREPGDDVFRAMSLDVLHIARGRLIEVTTFEPHLFTAFGLASRL